MRVVWSWLMELVDLPKEVSAKEGADALTRVGLEVEDFLEVGSDFDGVVIAEIASKEKHPDADKLTVCEVKGDESGQTSTVVCGAPNVPAVGGRVLWAKPGATLPGGFTLGEKKLKGVMSAGMLCAEDELGLGDDHGGIVVLESDTDDIPLGSDAASALGLKDFVFDLSIPANRADVLGHLGVARELAALFGGKVIEPAAPLGEPASASRRLDIKIQDQAACPRYLGRSIVGLEVKASPLWMQQRLRHVGVRPLNNLVDVTNYVMFETGQPLHAFDLACLSDEGIVVRTASQSETMRTLDDQERTFAGSELLICDGGKPVAVAGVMGGESAEVSNSTQEVFLESANFEPVGVRKTARALGLHSDSSYRFERGVDPNVADLASRRAAHLMAKVGGGSVTDYCQDEYPTVAEGRDVSMRLSRCRDLSGIDIAPEDAAQTLRSQGFGCRVTDDALLVTVPSSRQDVSREVDVIEEVVRIYGFDKVPATLPTTTVRPTRQADELRKRATEAMIASGFCEHLSYGFTSPAKIEALGYGETEGRSRPIAIDNPMTLEQSVMRTSLWPNLLSATAHNHKHEVKEVRLFELGAVFLKGEGEMPDEPWELCAVLSGGRPGWLKSESGLDFYDIRGALDRLMLRLFGADAKYEVEASADSPIFHPGVSGRILIDGLEVGKVGEIHPRLRKSFGIEIPVFGFEVSFESLPEPTLFSLSAIPRVPAVTRDVNIMLNAEVPAQTLRNTIEALGEELLESVTILEDYRDPAHIPEGKKSMLWSLTYRSPDRTLTDKEVDDVHSRIETALLSSVNGTRR